MMHAAPRAGGRAAGPSRSRQKYYDMSGRAAAVSLTSMLKTAPVRAMFREAFPVESVRLEGRMLAPPIGIRPNLVGAAFDYLLRFRLERGFAGCVVRPWVAEEAVAGINAGILACDGPAAAEANSRLEGARAAHRDYMGTGVMGDGLIAAALDLAQLDAVYRIGEARGFVDADPADVADLRGLLDVAACRFEGPTRSCCLNPAFGDASDMVGGADADIVVDGMLVDIKTTRNLSFRQGMYNQLVGYYILSLMGGIGGMDDAGLSSVGIYYARYGLLHAVPTDGIRRAAEGGFMDLFEKAARLMFGP